MPPISIRKLHLAHLLLLPLLVSGNHTTDSRPANWNHDYVDEQSVGFEVKISDGTPDERLGNVVRTTYAQKLYFFSYKFDSPVAGVANDELAQMAAGPGVDDVLCEHQLLKMFDQMDELQEILEAKRRGNKTSRRVQEKHLRLAKVLDSFGRYEAGFLTGRTHSLGSYTQCKGSQLLLDGELVKSRYCMANLDVSKHQHSSLKDRKTEPSEDLISVAICLPGSCHTKSFQRNRVHLQNLVNSQFKLPSAIFQEEHLKLDSVFCEIDPDSQLGRVPLSGWILLLFAGIWIGAVLYSTYAASVSPRTSPLVDCLNLKSTWQEFICDTGHRNFDGPEHRVSLGTLNPFKVWACAMVVGGHGIMNQLVLVMDGLRAASDYGKDPLLCFIAGTTVVVDSFYVISGMIIAYMTMKEFERRAKKKQDDHSAEKRPQGLGNFVGNSYAYLRQCLAFILMRYFRLVPLYFLIYWFKKSLMPILSSGPLWDYGYNRETEAGSCREESWLTPFTFQAAYLPLHKQCLPQAWSIAGDLFFSVVIAPIIMLMAHRPRLAAALSVVICVCSNYSMLLGFDDVDSHTLDGLTKVKITSLAAFLKSHSFLYTAPHYRIFSILIGVLAGYALHYYNRSPQAAGDQQIKQWPRWFSGPLTQAAIWFIILLLGFPTCVPYIRDNLLAYYTIPAPMAKITFSTGRLMYATASAIIFLRMVTDWKDNFWMRNSAGKFWSSVTKLNYAILLIHMDILKFDGYMQMNTTYFSKFAILKLFASTYLLCIPIALALHLLFENPVTKLVKHVIDKR